MSLSLRAYARHRRAAGLPGTTHHAVQVARDDGRLTGALTADGRIMSAELADAAWAASTHEDRVPLSGPTAPAGMGDTKMKPNPLLDARARREAALAEMAELELRRLKGEYGPVAEMRAEMIGQYTLVRNRLLGLPSKCRQRDPSFTIAQLALIDEVVREALTELADERAPGQRNHDDEQTGDPE